MPAIVDPLSFFPRVDQRKHSVVVEGILLLEVLDVDCVCSVLAGVLDSEIEPLSVGVGIVVWLQIEVVFIV